jgi:hypothetical protein
MSKELMGVPLERLEQPIRAALYSYEEQSANGLRLDIENAHKLELTPDKPNSARSATEVFLRDTQIGKLYVIAFKPGDGTGSQDFYQVKNLRFEKPYPASALAVPRKKIGVHSEVLLTIVAHEIENVHAGPRMYAGIYDLLGLDGDMVGKIGELGYSKDAFIPVPLSTFTVGYKDEIERFGDPHAVYSGIPAIQVCAFLAISNGIYQNHPDIWKGLRPQYPRKP